MARWILLSLSVAALACSGGDAGSSAPPAQADGPFEGPPARMVIDDYPPGLSAPPLDGRVVEAAPPPDAAPDLPEDVPLPVDAPGSCSLLAQDCEDPTQGCYPGALGQGECQKVGTLREGNGCLGSTQGVKEQECAKGLLCVDVFGLGQGRTCQPICDPSAAMGCARGTCQAFPGSSIGFCPTL